jgi:hypothetical protein
MSEQIRNTKDYYLRKLELVAYNGKGYDVSALRGNLLIYEDIFSPIMTAELELTDTMDMATLFPFIGEEKVRVIFTKQDPESPSGGYLDDVSLEFDVFKVTGRTVMNTKTQNYVLHLLSSEAMKSYKTRIFKSWKKVKYSEMAQNIFDDNIKITRPIKIEETQGEFDMVIGNKNPLEAINMLASRSLPTGSTSGKKHTPPVLFYEDRDGFNFVSLDSLLLKSPSQTFTRRIANERDPKTNSQNIDKAYKAIEFIDWVGWWDTMRLMDMGFYGQEAILLDPIQRKFTKKEFKISTDWGKMNTLEKEKVFTDSNQLLDATMAHRKLVYTNQGIEALSPDETSTNIESYLLERTSKLAQMFHTRFSMSIAGDPRRKVGEVLKLELPEEAGDVDENRPEKPNRYYYGNYLAIAMKHHISFSAYTIDVELARDSFYQEIEHEDPIERYKNSV